MILRIFEFSHYRIFTFKILKNNSKRQIDFILFCVKTLEKAQNDFAVLLEEELSKIPKRQNLVPLGYCIQRLFLCYRKSAQDLKSGGAQLSQLITYIAGS